MPRKTEAPGTSAPDETGENPEAAQTDDTSAPSEATDPADHEANSAAAACEPGRESASTGAIEVAETEPPRRQAKQSGDNSRTVSVSVPVLIGSAAVAVLAVALAVACFGWLSARGDLGALRTAADDDRHAEQVATDYAVGASTIDHQHVDAWVAKLKANTSPQLANKFDATAPKLEQILLPLKWTSTASPIAAKVASNSGGVYKVDVFVNVNSTNAQNPDGGQMTVTYNVTVDGNNGWQITDVGGLDGALPTK